MRYVDLKNESLPELRPREAILVRAATNPRQLLSGLVLYPLVDGPSAWILGVHQPGWDVPARYDDLREEHARVDPLYRGTIKAALQGEAERARELARELTELLEGHMAREEAELFPAARAALDPQGRILRELGYEHQGVRAGLAKLGPTLERMLRGEAANKEVEKLELDLLHMFEHHQEREEEALFPWLERTL